MLIPDELLTQEWWSEKRIWSKTEAALDVMQMASSGAVQVSCRSLASRWMWDYKKVERFLKKITELGWIEYTSTKLGSTIRRVSSDTPNDTPNDTPKARYIQGIQDVDDTPNDTPNDTLRRKSFPEPLSKEETTHNKEKDNNKLLSQKKVSPSSDMGSRARKFQETLKPFVDTYGRDMMNDFYAYWTEPNKSKTKMRYELERTWDVARRLNTWSRNNFRRYEIN
jgi:hypothetical protein